MVRVVTMTSVCIILYLVSSFILSFCIHFFVQLAAAVYSSRAFFDEDASRDGPVDLLPGRLGVPLCLWVRSAIAVGCSMAPV